MKFGVRNAYYLRISSNGVLPLYVYLDERHVDWMSERILQCVLADLRPLIPLKLHSEADVQNGPGRSSNAKKGSLDVHRGDGYQFGYFLRKAEPHSVILKTRYFVADPNPPSRAAQVAAVKPDVDVNKQNRKRKSNASSSANTKKKGRAKGKGKSTVATEYEEPLQISSEDETAVAQSPSTSRRRSTRVRNLIAGGYQELHGAEAEGADSNEVEPSASDEDITEVPTADQESHNVLEDANVIVMGNTEQPAPVVKNEDPGTDLYHPSDSDDEVEITEPPVEATSDFPPAFANELDEEDEDVKPKPLLQLRYRGFNLNDHCLCVILEPYPPLIFTQQSRSATPAPAAPRAPSIAPPDFVPSNTARSSRMPLFLPDPNRDRSETPAPFPLRASVPPVPLFDQDTLISMDDDETDDMMAFSQVLRSVGDHTAGGTEDDDEMDGAVFFGDADETRELS